MHIGNAYKEGELEKGATCKEYLQVQTEGKRKVTRKVKYYAMVLSLGSLKKKSSTKIVICY